MADLHDLIRRMADELDYYRQLLCDDRTERHALATEARAALAEPQGEGPAVPEVREPASVDQQATDGEVGELIRELRDAAFDLNGSDPAKSMLTRAADILTHLALQPVPVSSRLPGPGDCIPNPRNGEGEWCWGWRQDSSRSLFSGRWHMVPRALVVEEATHWLPAHALPLPREVQP